MTAKRKTVGHSRRKQRKTGVRLWLALVLAIILLCLGGWKIWQSDAVQMRFVYMWDYQQDIITYSKKNHVDPFLVAAIIKNESGFDNKAVSHVGAVGLMQIMPETGRWIAEQMGLIEYKDENLYQARTNIRMGCWYLGELEYEFKHNLALMLIAYNAGRGQTHEWMEKFSWNDNFNDLNAIPFPDTREYVIRVLQDRDKYYLLYCDKVVQN